VRIKEKRLKIAKFAGLLSTSGFSGLLLVSEGE